MKHSVPGPYTEGVTEGCIERDLMFSAPADHPKTRSGDVYEKIMFARIRRERTFLHHRRSQGIQGS